ncbi:putative disease resistance protein RGA3 [Camellia sinensis]|uniref:putative disease resistance protein RGA3 n=1 Tax=Camellia sinensis TaxID=4442 RepID=UPI00103639A0|nr:putative disease resistance protein RGA3 [Camellia sinensis]
MADLLISPLVTSILKTLNSLVLKEFGISWGLKTELENLESTLSTIQAVLQDAETKRGKSEALKNWHRKLNDAAYDADNLVDEFMIEAQRRRMDSERGIKPQVSAFFSLRNRLIFRLKMGHKIEDMRDRLDAIAGEKNKFHLREGVVETGEVCGMERGQTDSMVNESEIYGRTDEKEMIIEMLLNNSSDLDDDVSVYAMCGMGGLGKTTLAQLVYNDRRVDSHFDLRIWVCVSVDFDVERLTREILESIEGGGCSISNLDTLLRRLQEKLFGKRFLLVLDDVWNEYHEKWDRLQNALKCGAKGCTVIVTTRIQKVALIMATLPIHHMARLSEDDSWSLFKRRAFGNERREENLQLGLIGKEIVKKCKGLPLAIKALGSLMQFKRSESEWLSVKDSEIWDLPDDGSNILPALRLSYEALPPHLRQCFTYCCIFPKDYRMENSMLIELWMANDFIPSKGQMRLHDMGHDIFRDLVSRSFFQDVKESNSGTIFCKMHDLMHDLAQSIMRYECSIMKPHEGMKIRDKIRHLSFNIVGFGEMVPWNEIVFEVPSLRSVLIFESFIPNSKDNIASPCISKQKYLRVLDFGRNVDEKLSMSISNFSHLRYLDMSCSNIEILPESISNLQSLQTLKLEHCRRLRKLPKRMKHMRNLTYLDITGCDSLTSMPDQMGQLTCLQRLSMFLVGQDEGYQVGELKELNLGGTLSIKRLENVRNSEEAKKANLKGKHDLISLELYWSKSNEENIPKNIKEVLESLEPNSNLKKLRINFFQGSKFPNWMLGLVLKNLVEISLRDCERCEHLPPLGKLQSLKILEIRRMCSLKYFNHGDYGDGESSFPALKTLKFYEMPSLEEWALVDRGEIFPCLRELVISGCPKLTKLPFLLALKRLTIEGGYEMLFRSVINLTSISYFSIGSSNSKFEFEEAEHKLLPRFKVSSSNSMLKILPDGRLPNLKALKSLVLHSMYNLKTIHFYLWPELMSGLKNLNSLQINKCNSLTSLPMQVLQGLTSLTSLQIISCNKLKSLSDGMQYLTALQLLVMIGCPEIKSFPEGMQHLNALRDLYISDCSGLISLPNWLGSLRSLSMLLISGCPNLRCLPDGLQDQDTLKLLSIIECPHLECRCEKQAGEDWLKIAHIPEIWINGEQVQSLDC